MLMSVSSQIFFSRRLRPIPNINLSFWNFKMSNCCSFSSLTDRNLQARPKMCSEDVKTQQWMLAQDSPQRAEWIGDDDDFLQQTPDDNHYAASGTSDNIKPNGKVPSVPGIQDLDASSSLIDSLPDELLSQIFRFLPGERHRAVCAAVSRRWLMLQSHMERQDFYASSIDGDIRECVDEINSVDSRLQAGTEWANDDRRVERPPQWAIGDLSRCLEGKKATDTRLAAIAVGTRARGGLGKLSIRNGSKKGFTNVGLSAIGLCCPALRALSLWDCPSVSDQGLAAIGKGCRLLEKVDLYRCPLVGDIGLQSIAKYCSLVSFMSLDECGLVGNRSLCALSEGCPNLLTLSVRNCPLIGDDGFVAVVQKLRKIKRMKLEGLRVSDRSLACIGMCSKALISLTLDSLDLVTEEGFLLFSKATGMQCLRRLHVSNCKKFMDGALAAVGENCQRLKHMSLVKCDRISDQGLSSFVRNVANLEVLQLEMCNEISGNGLIAVFTSKKGALREVQVKKCDGIGNWYGFPSCLDNNASLRSICLAYSQGIGDNFLAAMGRLCQQLTGLDLTGLRDITDDGLMAFLSNGNRQLASINITGCVNLTDQAVDVISESCGESLRCFILDGCRLVTDKGIKAVAKHCVALEDLDVSKCSITNEGVRALLSETGQTLSSLSLSGCGAITDELFSLIEEHCQGLVDLNLKHCDGLTQRGLDCFESRLWRCHVVSM